MFVLLLDVGEVRELNSVELGQNFDHQKRTTHSYDLIYLSLPLLFTMYFKDFFETLVC